MNWLSRSRAAQSSALAVFLLAFVVHAARADEPGFKAIFNGKDLTGWNPIPAQNWRVEDGVIKGTGPDGFLFTQAGDFEDFHLVVEFRINDAGDSGIHFRAPPPRPDRPHPLRCGPRGQRSRGRPPGRSQATAVTPYRLHTPHRGSGA